jgi:acetamidase/formamidase
MNLAWPVAETDTHWIVIGLDKDLNAYALCSVAVSFRVTQVVDIVRLSVRALASDGKRRTPDGIFDGPAPCGI